MKHIIKKSQSFKKIAAVLIIGLIMSSYISLLPPINVNAATTVKDTKTLSLTQSVNTSQYVKASGHYWTAKYAFVTYYRPDCQMYQFADANASYGGIDKVDGTYNVEAQMQNHSTHDGYVWHLNPPTHWGWRYMPDGGNCPYCGSTIKGCKVEYVWQLHGDGNCWVDEWPSGGGIVHTATYINSDTQSDSEPLFWYDLQTRDWVRYPQDNSHSKAYYDNGMNVHYPEIVTFGCCCNGDAASNGHNLSSYTTKTKTINGLNVICYKMTDAQAANVKGIHLNGGNGNYFYNKPLLYNTGEAWEDKATQWNCTTSGASTNPSRTSKTSEADSKIFTGNISYPIELVYNDQTKQLTVQNKSGATAGGATLSFDVVSWSVPSGVASAGTGKTQSCTKSGNYSVTVKPKATRTVGGTTYTAIWANQTLTANNITIDNTVNFYQENGTTLISGAKYTSVASISVPNAPTKTGYSFNGYYIGTTQYYNGSKTKVKDLWTGNPTGTTYNLVAKYSENSYSFRLFDGYRLPEYPNNLPTSPFYTASGIKITNIANSKMNMYPEYQGYTLLGIYAGTTTSSPKVYDSNGLYCGDGSFLPASSGAVDLYCLYAPKDITITYDTHNTNELFDGDMGVTVPNKFGTRVDYPDVKTDVITYDTVTSLSNSAKVYDGYTFEGWYSTTQGSGNTHAWENGRMGDMGSGTKIFNADGSYNGSSKLKGLGNNITGLFKLATDTTVYPRYVPNAYTLYYYLDKANTQLASKTVYYDCPVEIMWYQYNDYSTDHYQRVPYEKQYYWDITGTGSTVEGGGFQPLGTEIVTGYKFIGWDWEDTGNSAVRPYFDHSIAGHDYYDTRINDSTVEANGNTSLWKWTNDRTIKTVYEPKTYHLYYSDHILLKDANGDLVDPEAMESLTTAWDSNNNPSTSEDFIRTQQTNVLYDSTDAFPGTIREYEGYTLDGYYGVLSFPYGRPNDYGSNWYINGKTYRVNKCDFYGHGWNNQRHNYENNVIDTLTDMDATPPEHEVLPPYDGNPQVPNQTIIGYLDNVDGYPDGYPVRGTIMNKWVGKVYNADGTLVDGAWNLLYNTNVYPRYTPNHYTLSINFNKEDDVASDQRDMTYNENFGLSDADKSSLKPYRGYTFNGWYDDNLGQIFDENGDNVSGNLWKYTQDVNAKATYTANDYVVYYNTNEADTPNIPLNVTFDQDYELPQSDVDKVPEKDGYTFIGWYDVDTGEKVFNIDGTPVNNPYNFDRDITVTVRYSNNPIDIRIATETDRKVNNGVGNRSEYEYDYSMRTETYQTPYGIITVPTKRGYDFGGYKVEPTNNGEPVMIWNADGKASEDIFKWLPTKGETVVYATSVFTPSTIKGDIDAKKYDPKTDTETDNPIHIEQVYDEPYDKLPHIPEKEGYIYDGITDKDGNPIWDKDGNPVQDVWQYIDGDIDNFIIKWTPKWYILTYDNNTKEQKVYFGEDVPNLDTMSKAGFRFNGYSFDYFGRETNIVDGTGKYTAGKWLYDMGESGQRIPLKDLWEVETYTVTVNDGIGEPYTVSVVYGMGYTNVEVPNKTGYVFEGYYVDGEDNTEFWNDGGKPTFDRYEYTKDISVTAKYRAKVFYLHCGDTVIKVTYDDIVNGTAPIGTKDDETVGNHINHYLFGGWTYNGMLIFGGDGLSTMDRWTLDLGEDGTHIYLEELFNTDEETIEEEKPAPEEEVQEPTIVPAEEPVIHGSWIHTLWNTPAIKRLIIGGGITFSGLGILFIILFILSKIARIYYLTDPEEERYKHFRGFEWINTYPRHKRPDRDHKYFIELSSKHYDALEGENTYVMVKFFPIFRFFHKGQNIDIGMRNEFSEYIIEKKILL